MEEEAPIDVPHVDVPEEKPITKESLAKAIADLMVDSTKSDRNQKLHNHAAMLRMYARQERALTKNYGVKNKDDEETK